MPKSRAAFEYELLDRFEAGIVLTGTEIKSLRSAKASIEDAYAQIEQNQVYLLKMDIPEYAMGNRMNHEPKRKRKLLLNRQEIRKLVVQIDERGLTLIPTRVYFKGAYAKIELAIAKGKQKHDKRQTIKKRETDRDIKRLVNARNLRTR